MWSKRIKHWAELRRRRGTAALGGWIAYRLAKRLVNARAVRVLWLGGETLDASGVVGAAGGDFTFRFLTAEEVGRWATDPANDLDAAMAARVGSGKDFCFAALAAGRLAGYAWFALGRIEPEHSADAGISFPADMAYLYKGYVHADFRGRRLYGTLIQHARNTLADRGAGQLLCLVEWTNQPALRSCLGSGWDDLGRLVTFGFGRPRMVFAPRNAVQRGIRFDCRS